MEGFDGGLVVIGVGVGVVGVLGVVERRVP